MIEKDIEKYLVRQVKQMGGLALKFVSPSMAGVPDYVIDTKDKVDKLLRGESFEI